LRFEDAIFESNTAPNAGSLSTTASSGQIISSAFREHPAASSTMSYSGLHWVCALGSWMPTSGEFFGDIAGCLYTCSNGYYGAGNTSECSGECWDGHYCPEGAIVPTPCPPGTRLPTTTLGYSVDNCIPCVLIQIDPPCIDRVSAR